MERLQLVDGSITLGQEKAALVKSKLDLKSAKVMDVLTFLSQQK